MINLLPPEEKNIIEKQYKKRLLSVYLVLLSGALFVGTILLLPSYFLADIREKDATREIQTLRGSDENTEREELNTSLRLTKERLSAIGEQDVRMELHTIIDTIAEYAGSSVALTNFSYSRGEGDQLSTLQLGGKAATRNGLLSFARTLEEDELFESVDLPVSSLAEDEDIEFNLELSGTF